MFHAHIGWLFDTEQTDQKRFAPDLLRDRSLVIVHKLFAALTATSLILPAVIGGLWGWSWEAAIEAFFWAGLVRIAVLHHVTWSVNSICHTVGKRPFKTRDRSSNVWALAVLGMGENWHNLHHAEPTSARHGVLRGQVDSSARLIQAFEKLGWATRRALAGSGAAGPAGDRPPATAAARSRRAAPARPCTGPWAQRTSRQTPGPRARLPAVRLPARRGRGRRRSVPSR